MKEQQAALLYTCVTHWTINLLQHLHPHFFFISPEVLKESYTTMGKVDVERRMLTALHVPSGWVRCNSLN